MRKNVHLNQAIDCKNDYVNDNVSTLIDEIKDLIESECWQIERLPHNPKSENETTIEITVTLEGW